MKVTVMKKCAGGGDFLILYFPAEVFTEENDGKDRLCRR